MFPQFNALRGLTSGLLPNVLIHNDTISDIEVLMRHAASLSTPCEVQWYLTCRRVVHGKTVNYVLDELTIPPQEVQPAYVQTTAAEQAEYNRDLQMRYGCQRAGAGDTPGTIKVRRYLDMRSPRGKRIVEEDITSQEFGERMENYQAFKNRSTIWCHSHVNMATNPSGTDDTQWKEWLTGFLSLDNKPENAAQRPDAVGMCIFNLQGQYFNRIKDNLFGVEHECVPMTVIARNQFPEGFLSSYVAKKAAPVAVTGGSTGTSTYSKTYGDTSSYGYGATRNPFVTVASCNLTGPVSTAPKTDMSLLTALQERAERYFDRTIQLWKEKFMPAVGEQSRFFPQRAAYACYPLSKSAQQDIYRYWDLYTKACFDVKTTAWNGYEARREHACMLYLAIGDYLGIDDSEKLMTQWMSVKDLGNDLKQDAFFKSLNPGHIYAMLAFKLAAYATHCQWGQAADFNFEKLLFTLLFDTKKEFTDFSVPKSYELKTGVTGSDFVTLKYTLPNKVISYEALIWAVVQIERWRWTDDAIPDYKRVMEASLLYFRNRYNEPPPMLLSDLGIAYTPAEPSLGSGPRLVGSEESTSLVKVEDGVAPSTASAALADDEDENSDGGILADLRPSSSIIKATDSIIDVWSRYND